MTLRLRLTDIEFSGAPDVSFEGSIGYSLSAKGEADEFYATVIPEDLSADAQNVMRQAFAGMLWSKQFYHYVIKQWLEGRSGQSASARRAQKWPQQSVAAPL